MMSTLSRPLREQRDRWISIFRWSHDRSSVWWPQRRTAWKSCDWGAWKRAVSRRRPRSSRACRCTSCGGTSHPTVGRGQSPGGPAGADGAPDDDVGGHVGRHPRGRRGGHPARRAGLDPWVIDFGSPDKVEGGMRRTLADHIVALSQAIDTVKDATGSDVHLVGYSQGGMWSLSGRGLPAFEGPRQHRGIRFAGGHPGRVAHGYPGELRPRLANFMADHVFNRLDIPSWMARTGFQMMDPLKTAQGPGRLRASAARPRGATATRAAAQIP